MRGGTGAVALLALLSGACGAGERPPAGEWAVATSVVEMPRHYRFEPEAVRVPAGTTILWRNTDDFTHSVRVRDGERRDIPPGDSARITFTEPGEYAYDCSYHPHDMKGVVVVTEAP